MHIFLAGGCVLGNPNGEHVVIPEKSQVELQARENICHKPEKLALTMLPWLFTPVEIAGGICTPQLSSDWLFE